ncbi:acyltransferase [Solitalea lacus]|uniref:acyltransferase n=1 Tax=Solitalea lacus TaxID=2911172 RepID=UPI001ED9F7E9|nr:acyltransferase family protein [Solitalea lacus]UKJ08257.1 acyltransferase family protein [Solitalea lacus]
MKETKLQWADSLRALTTIAVIILHVTAPLLTSMESLTDWWIGNIIESLVRFSVPVFFMLTGALLFDKEYSISIFLKKRFFRVVIPFIFWSIPYILFSLTLKVMHKEHLDYFQVFTFIIDQFKNGSSYHLWFVYTLLGIYLFTPIISKWIRSSTNKEILYFLIIWLITVLFTYPILSIFETKVDLSYFNGFLGYTILGYYLRKVNFESTRKKDSIAIFLFFPGLIITIAGTYFLFILKGEKDELYYSYLTFNVLMCAIGVYLYVKDKYVKNQFILKFLNLINRFSYGIYLVHVLILIFLTKAGITCFFIHPLIGIPATTILCLTFSVLIIYIVNKLPYGKYISG